MTQKENAAITGKVLVVDDEAPVAEILSEFLGEQGHEITISLTGAEAMRLVQDETYDVILTDLRLPDIDEQGEHRGGLKLLKFARQINPSIEVIIITGYGSIYAIKEAIRSDAFDFIVKPPQWVDVVQAVANAIGKRRLKVERDQLALEVERVQAERKELFDLATRDGLTNLHNYRYLQTQLQTLMTNRPLKSSLSLVMIDTDNFKVYNDRYGHLKGDEILREIAQVLASNIRDTDVAARYGGDEFIVLLRETNKEQAIGFAERCLRLIQEYSFGEEGPNTKLTISAGVTAAPEDATDPGDLIAKADAAMYAAKQAGRNQVHATGE